MLLNWPRQENKGPRRTRELRGRRYRRGAYQLWTVPGQGKHHLSAGIVEFDAPGGLIDFQNLDRPLALANGQDTRHLLRRIRWLSGVIHPQQHAFGRHYGGDAYGRDLGQRRWRWGGGRGRDRGRSKAKDIASGDAEVGIDRNIGNQRACARGQHKTTRKPYRPSSIMLHAYPNTAPGLWLPPLGRLLRPPARIDRRVADELPRELKEAA